MFDLPTTYRAQQVNYRKFKKFLKKGGFMRLQQSIYVKLIHNVSNVQYEIEDIRRNAPIDGDIKLLPMSLNNFKKITNICGISFNMAVFSDDIVICS